MTTRSLSSDLISGKQTPQVTCIHCNASVDIDCFSDHYKHCNKETDSSDNTSDEGITDEECSNESKKSKVEHLAVDFTSSRLEDQFNAKVDVLMSVFNGTKNKEEILRCMSSCNGNSEKAYDILSEHENGASLSNVSSQNVYTSIVEPAASDSDVGHCSFQSDPFEPVVSTETAASAMASDLYSIVLPNQLQTAVNTCTETAANINSMYTTSFSSQQQTAVYTNTGAVSSASNMYTSFSSQPQCAVTAAATSASNIYTSCPSQPQSAVTATATSTSNFYTSFPSQQLTAVTATATSASNIYTSCPSQPQSAVTATATSTSNFYISFPSQQLTAVTATATSTSNIYTSCPSQPQSAVSAAATSASNIYTSFPCQSQSAVIETAASASNMYTTTCLPSQSQSAVIETAASASNMYTTTCLPCQSQSAVIETATSARNMYTTTCLPSQQQTAVPTNTGTASVTRITDLTQLIDATKEMEIQEKLQIFREQLLFYDARPHRLYVERTHLLENNISFFKRIDFSILRPIHVCVIFEEEDAVDAGGPLRENFSLFFEEIVSAKLDMFIRTPTGYLLPTNNKRCIYGGLFEIVGIAVAAAAMNDVPSMLPLHPAIVSKMCNEDPSSLMKFLCIEDVPDTYARQFIKKMLECVSNDDLTELLNDETQPTHYVDMCGWDNTCIITLSNRHELASYIIEYSIIGQREEAIKHISKGLSKNGFLCCCKRSCIMSVISVSNVTSKKLYDATRTQINNMKSEHSSDINSDAYRTVLYVDRLLSEIDDQDAIDLVWFVTGTPTIMQSRPSVMEITINNSRTETSPIANTCNATLLMPSTYLRYEDFKYNILERVQLGLGHFGMA